MFSEKQIGRQATFELLAERHGPELQTRLASGRALVAGLGGLGSQVALALARCGVGALRLIDFDRVEAANIHRQAYFLRHIGRLKTEALAEMIAEINPWVRVETRPFRLAAENIAENLAGWPVIVEALDRPESKAELVSTALAAFPDAWVVCASGLAGLAEAGGIITRRAGRRLFVCGDGSSEIGPGVSLMPPRVMVCAGHQANAVVRILAGLEDED
ncbi:sulfur carrier protein ThiS adenylyltransferase ThiF [Deltaproteobacteria bacterium OttesenSCG-928-K17]|nr:sulfur carrier protein ThiS adenylyltransferase ThiF [Deltaproteobacteria bacterium OttesenSCG-928-K17]